MSSLYVRGNAIIRVTGVDLSAALGLHVKSTAGVIAVATSATVPSIGIVLEGNTAAKESSIGILGALPAPVRVKIAADATAIKQFDTLQQKNDGTFTNDAGAGNARCVLACVTDPNGAVAGDLVEAVVFASQIRA